jgi:hypothetical protein
VENYSAIHWSLTLEARNPSSETRFHFEEAFMRIMHLPEMPLAAQSREECIKLYHDRLSTNCACRPDASVLLTAYLAWPNDEGRRNSFVATHLARLRHPNKEASALQTDEGTAGPFEMFGGISAIADAAFDQLMDELSQVQRKWLLTADLFQLVVDMAFDERAVLPGGASVSKAVDLCEVEYGLPGHSQLRAAWSEFRDVAHLLTAGACLAQEELAQAGSENRPSILNAIWFAPDVVLTLAYGLQEFGLQPKPIEKESPILRPDTLWRIPESHQPQKSFVIFRRLTQAQFDFLNSRRVA